MGCTRRQALMLAVALGARGVAASREADSPIIINALGGIEDPNLALARAMTDSNPVDTNTPDVDARSLRDAQASGLTAVNVTVGYVGGAEEPFEYSLRTIETWKQILSRHAAELLPVLGARDILEAKRTRRIGIILGFQNAAMMGHDASRVDTFARLGVRVIQLTYNPSNQLGDGCMAAENRGLTAFGHEVVARLNARRIMVDLSHSGERTCLEAARASQAPVSINHTGCRAITDLPRNKSDAELRLVASRGGFVGIFFMPFLTPSGHARAEHVIAHLEHALDVCGEDHVGIGTDGDVTAVDDLTAYRGHLAREIAARRAAGLGAAGEASDTYPFVLDLRGPHQFDELAERLRERGHSASRVEKILGGNFLRYATQLWGS